MSAFYAKVEHTPGWQRREGAELELVRENERLQIRAEQGPWDGTRGTLGLTRITYRWEADSVR